MYKSKEREDLCSDSKKNHNWDLKKISQVLLGDMPCSWTGKLNFVNVDSFQIQCNPNKNPSRCIGTWQADFKFM